MNEQEELRYCTELLKGIGGQLPKYKDNPISPELAADYGRLLAAKKLGESSGTIAVQAALCRSALTSNEDDRVRVECVQQLMNAQSPITETVLFGLLFDEDEEMRLVAVEGLSLIKSSHLKQAALIVAGDDSGSVRSQFAKASSGQSIELYHLDPVAAR